MLDSLPGRAALLRRETELMESTPALVFGLQIVGSRYYTEQLPAGAQQERLYVREGVHGADRLLIDPEKLAGGSGGHLALKFYRPSPDNRYIVYTLASGGSEAGVLHILDTRTGKDLAETADRASGNPYWRADSRSFFYRRLLKPTPGMAAADERKNMRVYLHVLGCSFDHDPAILGTGVSDRTIALAPGEYPFIVTAPGSHYAVAMISQGTDARHRVYAAPVNSIKDGNTAWRAIAPSYDDQYIGFYDESETDAALSGNTLYWLSRKQGPRGEILKLDLSKPGSQPQVVVAQGALPISAVYASGDAIYWRVSDAGINSVHRLRFAADAKPQTLHLPYAASITNVITDAAGNATVLAAASWIRVRAYLGVDARSGAVTDTGLQPLGPYDRANDLVAEEVKVKSWDGTWVPLSIVYKKGLKLDAGNPTLLYGYGAYGTTQSPGYIAFVKAALERGVIMAVCHVRGGGEYGEAWHLAGYKQTKPNTWKDFIACAQYLIAHRYTSAKKLAGEGGSSGGILIGRAIEERPDLFAAAIANVPHVDTLRYETTPNGPSNIPECGSVKTEAGFRDLFAMSAYAHIQDGVKYPAVLVTTGINDPRVAAWIPAKFAARLQAATASDKPVLLRVDYHAGHGHGSSMQQALSDFADTLSFVLWQTGDPAFQPKQ